MYKSNSQKYTSTKRIGHAKQMLTVPTSFPFLRNNACKYGYNEASNNESYFNYYNDSLVIVVHSTDKIGIIILLFKFILLFLTKNTVKDNVSEL